MEKGTLYSKVLRFTNMRTFKMLIRMGYSSGFHLTRHLKRDPCSGGKTFKERVTVLLDCNAGGADKLSTLVSGMSENPRCFKNVRRLPKEYGAKRIAWVTQVIFTGYSQNRKVLLFINQCAAHP